MQIFVLRSDSLRKPEISDANKWMGFQLVQTPIFLGGGAILKVDFSELKPLFNNEQRQLEDLSTRVLHRIYRCIASRLNPCHCEMLFHQLKQQYGPKDGIKKNWLALVDIHLTFCDACFFQGHHDMTKRLVEVGEMMEAAERYSDAAKVYEDVTRNLSCLSNSSGCYDVITQNYAGLAYKRAGFLDKAETTYLEALRSDLKRNGAVVHTGQWVWNICDTSAPVSTSLLFSNLITNCYVQLEQAFFLDGLRCIVWNQDTARSISVLIGLLSVAGYKPPSHLATLFRQQAPKVKRGLIKKLVETPGAAIDTLARIVHRSKKTSQFRAHLIGCLVPGIHADLSVTLPRNRPSHNAENENIISRKEMKGALFPQCNKPECTRCRNAQYSISLKRAVIVLSYLVVLLAVQIAHWKLHETS